MEEAEEIRKAYFECSVIPLGFISILLDQSISFTIFLFEQVQLIGSVSDCVHYPGCLCPGVCQWKEPHEHPLWAESGTALCWTWPDPDSSASHLPQHMASPANQADGVPGKTLRKDKNNRGQWKVRRKKVGGTKVSEEGGGRHHPCRPGTHSGVGGYSLDRMEIPDWSKFILKDSKDSSQ